MTVPGWCRAARAGVFAAACVLLAALGHATMSGTPVPWWAMAAGALGTGAAGWLLAGRERGRVSIVAVVTAAQVVLHETFSLAQESASGSMAVSHGGPTTGAGGMHMGSMGSMDMGPTGSMGSMRMDMGSMGSMGSMRMDMGSMGGADMGSAGHAVHGMAGPGPLHDMAGMSGAASVGMVAAHFLAAVLCGLWLAYGERAVFRVLRATAAWLAAPLRLLGALPTPYHRPGVHRRRAVDAPAPVRLLLCCSLTFRGPPVGAAVR
ncbi:hypothetical protein ACH4OT_07285 [Streptomyces murinus]|uniref:hypothetical protein n=1 Tax=Streptomyces murinus TaxID=33900 RepID=UPI0018F72562|nr:hypothetical protein [Streptomyces murinus]